MFLGAILLLFINAHRNAAGMHCESKLEGNTCSITDNKYVEKFLFYDVNPPEGFNLRRDVYMRYAIMLAEAELAWKRLNFRLVLPPWYGLYHWKSATAESVPIPWNTYFDITSLINYVPVVELNELFEKFRSKSFEIDIVFVLQNYPDAFEGGTFDEKWELSTDNCQYEGHYWGYNNITAKQIICVKFQGKVSKLWELIALHPSVTTIMIAHAEIPLHDNYGTAEYWKCRKSMKFQSDLHKIAQLFMGLHLACSTVKCNNYICVHWRRQDFSQYRKKDVPSVSGTAMQIDTFIKTNASNIKNIFVATDAERKELIQLYEELKKFGYELKYFNPTEYVMEKYKDGGVAILDQIICSHAAYFIGTHESTFTFRIQEEREILGFDSKSTFNRLCPDAGKCDPPAKWTIVH